MPHTHQWRTTAYCLLALPRLGYADRALRYRCTTCPVEVGYTGELVLGEPLHDPAWWDAQQRQDEARASPYAQAARRGQTRIPSR